MTTILKYQTPEACNYEAIFNEVTQVTRINPRF